MNDDLITRLKGEQEFQQYEYGRGLEVLDDAIKEITHLREQLKTLTALAPIDHDEVMDRYYIPVHPDWEIQTKGKGSSFRIANTKTGERWLITNGEFGGLYDAIEHMARDINTSLSGKQNDDHS